MAESPGDRRHGSAVTLEGRSLLVGAGGSRQVLTVRTIPTAELREEVSNAREELLQRNRLQPERRVQVVEPHEVTVKIGGLVRRRNMLQRVPSREDRHFRPPQPLELARALLALREVEVRLVRELEGHCEALLDSVDAS